MAARDILTNAREILHPMMEKDVKATGNVMVIGTVEGCFHILPNEILSATFTGAGFKVINIGVNCSAQQFVKAVKEHKANVVGMSALLSRAIPYFKVVVDALKEAGLRDKVVAVIGGCHMYPDRVEESGADCFGVNAVDGLHKVQALLAEKKK
jgi:5-methyltetrahydrofolate--homocysteine methyltransferase